MTVKGDLELIRQNFIESLRTKWLISFSIVFFFLAINVPNLLLLSANYLPPNYLSFFLTFLVSLSFPYLPLLALPIGAISIVQERESRSMEYVLSSSISRHGFLASKILGLELATTSVLIIGYGTASLVAYRVGISNYLTMAEVIGVAALLNAIMLALAILISIITRRRETALAMSIFAWFVFAVISSLGQLSLILNLTKRTFLVAILTFLDPTESGRVLATLLTNPVTNIELADPTQVGVTGETMLYIFGNSAVIYLFISLVIWASVIFLLCFFVFRRQDIT